MAIAGIQPGIVKDLMRSRYRKTVACIVNGIVNEVTSAFYNVVAGICKIAERQEKILCRISRYVGRYGHLVRFKIIFTVLVNIGANA